VFDYEPNCGGCLQDYQDTPDYTVCSVPTPTHEDALEEVATKHLQDSDTNPNTTASSIAGDIAHLDGRKRRSEAFQLRKSVLGKKHGRLDESKVSAKNPRKRNSSLTQDFFSRRMTRSGDFATF
jgi:hypothetical protein